MSKSNSKSKEKIKSKNEGKKILFQMSGSIAAFKACQLVSDLVKAGFDVQTVGTPSLLNFVGRATLEGLTGRELLIDLWREGRAMDHIELARTSDLILLCPATANTINKLANGIAEDLVGALFLANNFKVPYWVVPAMNSEMYGHPATQKSLKTLSDWGCRVFETQDGSLACGEFGKGRMVEPNDLYAEVLKYFKTGSK